MITDTETNLLYLSNKLEQDYYEFYIRLIPLLDKLDIKYDFLPYIQVN